MICSEIIRFCTYGPFKLEDAALTNLNNMGNGNILIGKCLYMGHFVYKFKVSHFYVVNIHMLPFEDNKNWIFPAVLTPPDKTLYFYFLSDVGPIII